LVIRHKPGSVVNAQAAGDHTPSRGALFLANTPPVLYFSRHVGSAGAVRDAGEVAMKFTRITVDPQQMGGVPCIRRLRIPVAAVVGMIADGMSETDILAAYPDLQREDIPEALHYAAEAVRERGLPLTVP
jgi:uncharacterized protein (DUF433 family)